MTRAPLVICAVAFCVASAAAIAADPLGFYIGGSVGEAHVRSTNHLNGPPLIFDESDTGSRENHSGWKAFVGARPIPVMGIEVAYTNFGNAFAPGPPGTLFGYFSDNLKQSAITAFGVGYLPLPIPFLELYGKLGIARLNTNAQETIEPPTCPATDILPYCGPHTLRQDQWTTEFAYGAGVQGKFGQFAVRAEYERINASGGDPDLLSVGILWRF